MKNVLFVDHHVEDNYLHILQNVLFVDKHVEDNYLHMLENVPINYCRDDGLCEDIHVDFEDEVV